MDANITGDSCWAGACNCLVAENAERACRVQWDRLCTDRSCYRNSFDSSCFYV
jgi:hypothetical protein